MTIARKKRPTCDYCIYTIRLYPPLCKMYHYMYPFLWRAGVPESAFLTNYSLLPRTLSVEKFFQIQLIGNLCVTPVCICNTFDWNKYSMFPCSLTVGSLLSLLDRRSYCWIPALTVGSPLLLLDRRSHCWISALTAGSLLLTVLALMMILVYYEEFSDVFHDRWFKTDKTQTATARFFLSS